jgi:hypothetical protein
MPVVTPGALENQQLVQHAQLVSATGYQASQQATTSKSKGFPL